MLKIRKFGECELLNKNDTDCLKAILAIMVLVHHVYQRSGLFHGTAIGSLFQIFGYLAVGAFLFLSGYGLAISYNQKGEDYIRQFPRRRLFDFYLKDVFLVLLYTIFAFFIGQTPTIRDFFLSFVFGKTVIANGWYVQAIVLLYVVFYLSYKFAKKTGTKILGVFWGICIYIGLCICLDLSATWYECAVCFFIGVVVAHKNNALSKVFRKKIFYILAFVGAIALLGAFIVLGNTSLFPQQIKLVFKMLSAIFFCFAIILTIGKFSVDTFILRGISKISFEIYVSQGLFLSLFRSQVVYIDNSWLYSACVVVATVVFSIPLNYIFKKISKLIGDIR